MPLRRNPTLWTELPGIVAAYQPVRAPDAALARYNMAHGGDNRYLVAMSGVAPVWTAATGWQFTAAVTGNASLAIAAHQGWSLLVFFSDLRSSRFAGFRSGGTRNLFLAPRWSTNTLYYYGGTFGTRGPAITSGVAGMAGEQPYINGVPDGAAFTPSTAALDSFSFNDEGQVTVQVKAAAIVARKLSPAEVWQASRQMAYCDVNPDWSVWGRRRQWFYGPQVGSAQVLTLGGSLTASGAAQRATATGMLGNLTGSGTASKRTGTTLAGSVTGSGLVASLRTRLLALAGSLTASGGLLRRAGRNLAGSVTGSGGAIRQAVKGLVGSLTASATLARSRLLFVTLVGSLTGAGGLVRQIGKVRPASLTASGAVGRLIGKGLAGLLTGLGGLLASLVPRYKIHVTVAHTRVYQAQVSDGRVTVVTVADAVVG